MMSQRKKIALVIGATGLVGEQLVAQLLDSPYYTSVVTLVRHARPIQHPKLQQEIFDFDQPDANKIKGDDLFCALGTTLRKAGSKAAQYKIDCTYPAEIGRMARQNGVEQYLLVSSLGADPASSNFYLRTKGDLETTIRDLHFANFVAARPSFLLGKRAEFRLGERIGIFFFTAFSGLIPKKYRGISAEKVAKALIALANRQLTGTHIVESDKLHGF